jgi:hypothetical protein
MKDHHEIILQQKSRRRRYWMWDIGGQLFTKMCMITVDHVIHAKEQVD